MAGCFKRVAFVAATAIMSAMSTSGASQNYFTKPVTIIGATSTGIAPTGIEAILAAQRAPAFRLGRGPMRLQERP